MAESKGQNIEKISRLIAEMIDAKEKINSAKKGLRDVLKESEDIELKERLKDLKSARRKLSAEIKELQEQIEQQALANNPEIRDFREKVLEMEEKEADLRVSIREEATPLLEKEAILEFDLQGLDTPAKVQLLRTVTASINGREQAL